MSEEPGPFVVTFCGEKMYPLAPKIEQIYIQDIAHALSMLPVFHGHCANWYPLSAHCVHVSRLVAPAMAREALLSRAASAYLGDMDAFYALPFLNPYRMAYRHLTRMIYEKFEVLDPHVPLTDPFAMRAAHAKATATEARDLIGKSESYMSMDPDDTYRIPRMSPKQAENEFLDRWAELGVLASQMSLL